MTYVSMGTEWYTMCRVVRVVMVVGAPAEPPDHVRGGSHFPGIVIVMMVMMKRLWMVFIPLHGKRSRTAAELDGPVLHVVLATSELVLAVALVVQLKVLPLLVVLELQTLLAVLQLLTLSRVSLEALNRLLDLLSVGTAELKTAVILIVVAIAVSPVAAPVVVATIVVFVFVFVVVVIVVRIVVRSAAKGAELAAALGRH